MTDVPTTDHRPPTTEHTVLAVIPHPDDEAYSMGGTLALAARDGAAVHLLCLTRGDGGQSSDPSLASREAVGTARVAELEASCRMLGAHPPHVLSYPDGGLDTVDLPEAVGEIVRVIREVRPEVVITLGADGVYGHPDHVALHKLVTPAFRSAGGGTRFPDDVYGPSFSPSRLLWTAFPRGLFRSQWEQMLRSEHAAAMRRINPDQLGVDPAEFHLSVDIREVAAQKLAAIACHRTQLPDGDPRSLFPRGIIPLLLGVEYFQHGGGAPLPSGATNPFEGLDVPAE